MPKAEVGSTKWLSNNMKQKGLQRLRWYCQVCERQMRDENGFKQHCLSEAHNRNMQVVGENSRKFISNYSDQFKKDFLRLLRTAHGEKKVHANHFYQEYIAEKSHIHMNATRWPSLTEFVKYLGREGICRVEEGERGLEIAWVDDSPEALRRREAVLRKDRMEKGDEERQTRMLEAQIKRAQEQKKGDGGIEPTESTFERKDDGPISFSLTAPKLGNGSKDDEPKSKPATEIETAGQPRSKEDASPRTAAKDTNGPTTTEESKPMSISFGGAAQKSKPVNVFSSRSNPLKQKKVAVVDQPKKMSELERVMLRDKEEQEKKRQRSGDKDGDRKRIRL
ncbi:C2H2 finger domain protein [Elsinoe ampelina]|uniref:C2H2 finger domain protein n=1 Tax=Elsinoe ampelina TaxID=302913 RepID=A0A6A6FZX3_9PEZI|nr:C2H2 finger domain protein [Elsinoe ampelina]